MKDCLKYIDLIFIVNVNNLILKFCFVFQYNELVFQKISEFSDFMLKSRKIYANVVRNFFILNLILIFLFLQRRLSWVILHIK